MLSPTALASFGAPDGMGPKASLIMDSSGNLYGTASGGGASNEGTVFELAHGSSTPSVLASFNGANGANPRAGLIMDSGGNLYGTTYGRGYGTVFELAHGSSTITTLASFNGTDGANPYAGLIMDSSGNLYGTTYSGGASKDGTVFELAKGSGTITDLASFNQTDGGGPTSGLIMDGSGNLYGTTTYGGVLRKGTVFELAKGSGTITTLASFNGTDGGNSYAALTMDSSGNLYGTTYYGGASGDGTLFELAKGTSTITALASFNGADGANPYAALVMDSSGNLYGTTYSGGSSGDGTLFEVTKGSTTITALASFNGADGAYPEAALVMDGSGNLYGTTFGGGAPGGGTVFEMPRGSGTITTLASFVTDGGAIPEAGMVMDSSGNLYGTTTSGGALGKGTVFELAHGSGTLTTLAWFNGADGASPEGALSIDSSGDLYGTASAGGASNDGTIFELAKGSSTITLLASFNGTDGANPRGGLSMDKSGNLYGTTFGGGAPGGGTVFELAKGSSTITTLASFNGTDGANPGARLIMDSSGNLYGTADAGGTSSYGTIFKLAKGSSTITLLASFDGTDGVNPDTGLIMDTSGNLYGTAFLGGASGDGTIFKLAKGSGTITLLASFNGKDGAYPQGVIMDSSGNLYGTAEIGGASNNGTAFELPKGTHKIKVLALFNGTDGANPTFGGVIMDSSGNLYGTTYNGGALGDGTVFEVAGAAAPTLPGIDAGFVMTTAPLAGMGAIQTPATAASPGLSAQVVLVAGHDMAEKKTPTPPPSPTLDFEPVKSDEGRGSADFVLSLPHIDQLFAGEWNASGGMLM